MSRRFDKNSRKEAVSFNDEVSYDRRTQMSPLTKGLEKILGRIDPTGEKTHIQTAITEAWKDIAGESVSAHTEAVFIKGSVLVVWLDSQIWVQELTLMGPLYKDKLNEVLGKDTISECRFTLRDSTNTRFQKRFQNNTK